MKNTYQQVASSLKVYQQTIRNFCNDFEIDFNNQFIGRGHVSNSIFRPEFVKFLKLNKDFISKYESDNYENKTTKIIAKKIDRPITEIENYLKKEYPKYYKDGSFKFENSSSLRYISSFAIDYKLGGSYSFLKLNY
jgi:hypothetical protein